MKFIATIDKDRLNTIQVQARFEDFDSELNVLKWKFLKRDFRPDLTFDDKHWWPPFALPF